MSRRGFLRNVLGITTAIVVAPSALVETNTAHVSLLLNEKLSSPAGRKALADTMVEFVRQRMEENRWLHHSRFVSPIPNSVLEAHDAST